MKLLSCFLFILLIKMQNAKRNSTSEILIRIPLWKPAPDLETARSLIPLDDSQNIHFANITIGSNPPQEFSVLFDTGSDDLWIYSSFYDPKDSNWEYINENHRLYNHTASSTYQPQKKPKKQKIKYVKGWVSGVKSTDVVSLSGSRIKTEFIEITKVSDDKARAKYDGIMGLKYDPKDGNIVSKFCDDLKQDRKISIYLPRVHGDALDGEIILCGEDKSKFKNGTMKYVDVTQSGYWRISIDSVKAKHSNRTLKLASRAIATIDTGTNLILGPMSKIKKLKQLMTAESIDPLFTNRQIDCKTIEHLPNLIFKIGGVIYTLKGEEYTWKKRNHCGFLLSKGPDDHWIIGTPFFRKYYTVFDMEHNKIGFGESNG